MLKKDYRDILCSELLNRTQERYISLPENTCLPEKVIVDISMELARKSISAKGQNEPGKAASCLSSVFATFEGTACCILGEVQ